MRSGWRSVETSGEVITGIVVLTGCCETHADIKMIQQSKKKKKNLVFPLVKFYLD